MGAHVLLPLALQNSINSKSEGKVKSLPLLGLEPVIFHHASLFRPNCNIPRMHTHTCTLFFEAYSWDIMEKFAHIKPASLFTQKFEHTHAFITDKHTHLSFMHHTLQTLLKHTHVHKHILFFSSRGGPIIAWILYQPASLVWSWRERQNSWPQ
jgi:hypothetical protein